MELNQKFLDEQIEIFEKGYVTSIVELIKLPIFVKQIEKELQVCDEEKKKQLETILENNKIQEKGHKENLENIEEILKQIYLLKK